MKIQVAKSGRMMVGDQTLPIEHASGACPPLWARRQHAPLSRSGPGCDPRSGQVSWVRFFRGFSSLVRQMSGSFRPPRSPSIIRPSLSSSSLIIHYGCQRPEMLTCPKTLNIHTYHASGASLLQLQYVAVHCHEEGQYLRTTFLVACSE